MNQYIIYSDEGDPGEFKVVSAENEQEAKTIYNREVELKHPGFLSYVYGELFEDAFMPKGRSWRRAQLEIKYYFKNNPDYANLFIEFLSTDSLPIEEPTKFIESPTFGTIEDGEDFQRRWNNYIRQTHDKWKFPEEMLVMLANAAWTKDKKIVPIEKFKIN